MEQMVYVPVIQRLYNLSDEQMEFQLLDRLIKAGGQRTRLRGGEPQLERHGYIARGGQMIDASIVSVLKQTLSKEERSLVQHDTLHFEGVLDVINTSRDA